MALIPKTVGELRRYLETYPDDMPVGIFDDNEGYFWHFTVMTDKLGIVEESNVEVLTFERFRTFDPWAPS